MGSSLNSGMDATQNNQWGTNYVYNHKDEMVKISLLHLPNYTDSQPAKQVDNVFDQVTDKLLVHYFGTSWTHPNRY